MTKNSMARLCLGSALCAVGLTISGDAWAQVGPIPENPDLAQVTSVRQFRDVSPAGWAFEALRNLVEEYGCIEGYPDSTFRGSQALSRDEFAAGMNACLDALQQLLLANQPASLESELVPVETALLTDETVTETFGRAFNHHSGDYWSRTSLVGQIDYIFGFRAFPGSFPENQIARDAKLIDILYQGYLDQQTRSLPLIRTRDLNNPYGGSLGSPQF